MKQLLIAIIWSLVFSSTFAVGQVQPVERQAADLPKVVLVGDSIRLSYAPAVSKQLVGKANIVSSKSNGGDSANVLKNLRQWVIRENPTIVHFNCGIHDTKRFKATGKHQVSPADYAANLRKIVSEIREHTSAVVIFATTTPILDERAAASRNGRDYELLGESVNQYNQIAEQVMRELKVPVNDLHAALTTPENAERLENLIGTDGVHLAESGKAVLADRVSAVIGRHLASVEP